MKISAKSIGTVDVNNLTSLHIKDDQSDAVFSDRTFDSFLVEGSKLSRCTFSRVKSPQACFGAGIKTSVFEDCVFDQCSLDLTVAGRARLVKCRFVECELENVIAPCMELLDCIFEGTLIRGAAFHGAVPVDKVPSLGRSTNDFYGNDFSSAKLVDVAFSTGIDLSRQSLPDGEQYLYIASTAAAVDWLRKAPTPSDKKQTAIYNGLVGMLIHDLATGQENQFLEGPFPPGFREAAATFGSFLA